jgi:hypothetical protein
MGIFAVGCLKPVDEFTDLWFHSTLLVYDAHSIPCCVSEVRNINNKTMFLLCCRYMEEKAFLLRPQRHCTQHQEHRNQSRLLGCTQQQLLEQCLGLGQLW